MSETQLLPLDGYELRNPKASWADESCVVVNRITRTIGPLPLTSYQFDLT